jgi:predicted NAD/FAD-binding protein
MYVTYNCSSEARRKVIGMPLGEVDNTWAHPQLSMASMAISMAMPLLQGQSRASYCASYTTPGNGHDLSLLSGLVVARSLTGYYPFEDEAGVAERGDFDALAGIMSW